jgi:hypothetical protein
MAIANLLSAQISICLRLQNISTNLLTEDARDPEDDG